VIVTPTGASNRIEGNKLSDDEVQVLLESDQFEYLLSEKQSRIQKSSAPPYPVTTKLNRLE